MQVKLWTKGLVFLLTAICSFSTHAADLIQVYRDAVCSDPIYHQALAQQFSDIEGVPISLSNLLPNAGVVVTPSLQKVYASGSGETIGTHSARIYDINLTINQTVFDFGKFANLAIAKEVAKQARATFNAATQDLMVRTTKAYLTILEDEDNLLSVGSAKTAFAKQLDQVTEEYKMGLKTVTDVDTAKAAYENSATDFITAETQLANDKENLRVITGNAYPSLAKLSRQFPLISPSPANSDQWVETAERQNWSIKAAAYAKSAAIQNIKQQFAGHLPTLNLQGIYDINFERDMGGNNIFNPQGPAQVHTRTLNLILSVPIYQGGGVVAKTNQAKYNCMVASQKLEKQVRDTINLTRQSYLGVISGISKINADIETVKSLKSSLEGFEARYAVGTQTLLDVLTQRQRVFLAEKQYASDRYTYVSDLLNLKLAAGTLSAKDLVAINSWLKNGATEKNVRVFCKRCATKKK